MAVLDVAAHYGFELGEKDALCGKDTQSLLCVSYAVGAYFERVDDLHGGFQVGATSDDEPGFFFCDGVVLHADVRRAAHRVGSEDAGQAATLDAAKVGRVEVGELFLGFQKVGFCVVCKQDAQNPGGCVGSGPCDVRLWGVG